MAQNQIAEFINTVSDQSIIDGLNTAVDNSLLLQEHSQDFCKHMDTRTLEVVQKSWKKAMHSWSAMGLFRFGPMIENNIDLKIHYLPISKAQIKAKIISPPAESEQLPVSTRGLASLEFLIFDPNLTNVEIVEHFRNKPNQCRYLIMLANLLVDDQNIVLSAWKSTFVNVFKGLDNSITQHEALSEIVTAIIRYFESSLKNRLTRPAGLELSSPLPYKSESWRSGESTHNMIAAINSFESLLTRESGLSKLLNSLGHSRLANALVEETNRLKNALMSIKPSLFVAVTQSPDTVATVIKHYELLTELIKMDVAKTLEIQLGFNDDDGD